MKAIRDDKSVPQGLRASSAAVFGSISVTMNGAVLLRWFPSTQSK